MMSDLLRHFVEIRKDLSDVETRHDGNIEGSCVISNDVLLFLEELDNHNLVSSEVTLQDGSTDYIDQLNVDSETPVEARICLYPSRLPSVENKEDRSRYFGSLDELIRKFTCQCPEYPYYVHGDVRSFSIDEPLHSRLKAYEDTVRLADMILEKSEFSRECGGVQQAFYFKSKKVRLDVRYDSSDIRVLEKLDKLLSDFEKPDEGETRFEVFTFTLEDFLNPYRPEKRFSKLLESFDQLWHMYRKGYQRYINQFSYEKLMSDFSKDKATFLKDMNEVVSSVQNKVIAIPVAIFFAGSQVSSKDPFSAANLIILLGSIIFTIIVYVTIIGNKNVLDNIKNQIRERRRDYLDREPNPPEEVKHGFVSLLKSYHRLNAVLNLYNLTAAVFSWSVVCLMLFYWIVSLDSASDDLVMLSFVIWLIGVFVLSCLLDVLKTAKHLVDSGHASTGA